MKKIYPFIASFILMVLMSNIMSGQKQEKIHLKVITLKDGQEKILEKTYENMEEMQKDPDFLSLEVEIQDLEIDKILDAHSSGIAKAQYKEVKIEKNSKNDEEHAVIFVKTDSIHFEGDVKVEVEVEEDVIKIITQGEEGESVQTITKEIDGKQYVIKTHGDRGDSDDEKHIWVTKKKIGDEVEIEREVEVTEDEEGNIKVIINGEEVNADALHELSIDGDTEVLVMKTENSKDVKEVEKMVNVIVQEMDDTRHIEIRVEETSGLNVHIANIEADDESLSGVKYAVKNDLDALELNYYPNPNDGHFSLKFRNTESAPIQIQIRDILGKEIFSENIENFNGELKKDIDIQGKEKGLYILQITQMGKAISRKIVIE